MRDKYYIARDLVAAAALGSDVQLFTDWNWYRVKMVGSDKYQVSGHLSFIPYTGCADAIIGYLMGLDLSPDNISVIPKELI